MKGLFVTGFYGTGSSAVVDLLSEFDGVNISMGRRYEHCPFLGQDGLLDLYQRAYGKYANRMTQDRAINDFIEEMRRQNDNDFGWYGSYKKAFGNAFSLATEKFVESISSEGKKNGFAHGKGVGFSPLKAVLQIGASVLRGYKITKLGRKYRYDSQTARYLTASEEEFLAAARRFTTAYLDLCHRENEYDVYDHILLPEQCGAMRDFFPESKLIVVDRDPRDVYLSAYHVWNTVKWGKQEPPFPKGIEAFCEMWKSVHERTESAADEKYVKIVRFEDLVYRYEETVKEIADFCELDLSAHTKKNTCFQPQESVKNTQVFLKSADFSKDAATIESLLSKYSYPFPYATDTKLDEVKDL